MPLQEHSAALSAAAEVLPMKNAFAIAKKELNIYFATPIAYVMFTLFVIIGSYFFLRLLSGYQQASLRYMQSPAILACTLALTLIYPASVQLVARDQSGVEWRSIFLGYAGLFLLGSAYMALGLFISSLTESQVVAALITFVLLLMTWIIGWTASEAEGWVRELVSYLASVSHLDSFSKGTLDLKDVIYFLSIIVLGLFATNRAVEAHRWS